MVSMIHGCDPIACNALWALREKGVTMDEHGKMKKTCAAICYVYILLYI